MNPEPNTSRRDFLATSAVAGGLALAPSLFAGQNSALKVGLVGCGGRGTGAAKNTLKADSNVKLVAMADMFDDKIKSSLTTLKRNKELAAQVDVKPDMMLHRLRRLQEGDRRLRRGAADHHAALPADAPEGRDRRRQARLRREADRGGRPRRPQRASRPPRRPRRRTSSC